MEAPKGNGNTISLIMEVEEIVQEEAPSDSESADCVVMRSSATEGNNKTVPECPEVVGCTSSGVNGAENDKKPFEELKVEDSSNKVKVLNTEKSEALTYRQVTEDPEKVSCMSLPVDKKTTEMQSGLTSVLSEGKPLQTTPSLEEKLTAMFEEDKKEPIETSDISENKPGQTLEEQLTEIFQDKSENEDMSTNITTDTKSPVEENLIAIFEEEDSIKSRSSPVSSPDSKSHKNDHVKGPETNTGKELQDCSVLLDKNVNVPSKAFKIIHEKKSAPLKRKISEKEVDQIDIMREMKEAKVVLKKLKLPSSKLTDHKLDQLSNKGGEVITHHKSVENKSSSQNLMLHLSNEKSKAIVTKALGLRKNTSKIREKVKHSIRRISISPETLCGQGNKGKKVRLNVQDSLTTSLEKSKVKPEKPSSKTLGTLQNFEEIANDPNESTKVSVPKAVKRKRGRPASNHNVQLLSPPKVDKKKPVKTVSKTQESPIVSRVSERLQLKMMKTRSIRKKKVKGDKNEGEEFIPRKRPQKREHVLKLQTTAMSIAKRRKNTKFSIYGLARKKRLLNALKNASAKQKQLSSPTIDAKQMTVKHKYPIYKQSKVGSLPELTVALTPVSVKMKRDVNVLNIGLSKGNRAQNVMEKDKKNVSGKASLMSYTDSDSPPKHSLKKSDNKEQLKQEHIVVTRPMVTRSRGGVRAKLSQQKKAVSMRSNRGIFTGLKNKKKKKRNNVASANIRKKRKDAVVHGLEVRNNEGVVELLVEDPADLTENDVQSRRTSRLHATENDSNIDKTGTQGKKSPIVEVPSGMTDAEKMVEMRKAIWNLETRIDRYKLRQQAEERMVVYLSSKLRFYENNKYVQALMRMLKDAAPGPQQNQDAVFITDLLLGYCPENENQEKES